MSERAADGREVKCRLDEFTLLINRQRLPAGAVVPPRASSGFRIIIIFRFLKSYFIY